jgi:DNA-binding MarR family transcriptional regulator
MTQTISDLEADGLIERRADPGDGRRALVELTPAGSIDAALAAASSARSRRPPRGVYPVAR